MTVLQWRCVMRLFRGIVVGVMLLISGVGCGRDEASTSSTIASKTMSSLKPDAVDQVAADDLAASLGVNLAPLGNLTEQETQCIADAMVATFGAPAPAPLAAVASLPPLDERREQAVAQVDIYIACTESWELLFLRTRTEGADKIGDVSAACVTAALPDDESRSMWTTEATGSYTDLSHLDPLFAVLDKCLTTEELNALDWN